MSTDKQNFKNLFYAHYNNLCRHAYKYVNDREESKDIVQQVFIKFWELKKDSLAGDAAQYYLFTAVRNQCISHLRKKVYHSSSLEGMDGIFAVEEYQEPNVQHVAAYVNSAFEGLPAKCSDVFRMSRLKEMSYRQIADALNISVKTVENHMGKAIRHMRNFINNNPLYGVLYVIIYLQLMVLLIENSFNSTNEMSV